MLFGRSGNGKSFVTLDGVAVGKSFVAKPDPNFSKGFRKDHLGLYVRDSESEQEYAGYILDLNERDSGKDEYNLVIRSMNKNGKRLGDLWLHEALSLGDMIHLQVGETPKSSREKFRGNFLGYDVLVDRKNDEVIDLIDEETRTPVWVKANSYVFGKVVGISQDHKTARLVPISVRKKIRDRDKKHVNRIF